MHAIMLCCPVGNMGKRDHGSGSLCLWPCMSQAHNWCAAASDRVPPCDTVSAWCACPGRAHARVRGQMHRAMRDLSFVDVVPLDTLLEVLASDSPPVALRVHRLLVPSYFPGPVDGPACVAALLRQSPEVSPLSRYFICTPLNGPAWIDRGPTRAASLKFWYGALEQPSVAHT